MHLPVANIYIYNDYQNLNLFLSFGVTEKPFFESSHRRNITWLASYWQRLSQSLQITWIGYVD